MLQAMEARKGHNAPGWQRGTPSHCRRYASGTAHKDIQHLLDAVRPELVISTSRLTMMTPEPRSEPLRLLPCCWAVWMAASFCSGDSPACTSSTPSTPAQLQLHALLNAPSKVAHYHSKTCMPAQALSSPRPGSRISALGGKSW